MDTADIGEPASCCSVPATDGDSTTAPNAVARISTEAFPPDAAADRTAGFWHLFTTGTPISPADLAGASGVAEDRLDAALASVRDRGRIEFDERGNLIGIGGLSLTPGRHRFVIDNASHWTWCALDIVGILGALKATGSAHSTDPHSGEAIDIEYVDGYPETDVHLFVLGGFLDANVRKDWCPYVNFFVSHQSAEQWAADHRLDGDVVAVSSILEDAAVMWRPVVAVPTPPE